MPTPPLSDDTAKRAAAAYVAAGGVAAHAARALGLPAKTFDHHLAVARLRGFLAAASPVPAAVEVEADPLEIRDEAWCVREQCSLKLENPRPPERPRMRVPAVMERA